MSTLSIVAIIYVNNCIHMDFIAFWNLLINFCSVLFFFFQKLTQYGSMIEFYIKAKKMGMSPIYLSSYSA